MTIDDNNWKVHLEKMTEFARLRRQRHEELRDLTSGHIYIRVGGNGFRPVSLHPDNPCGSLYIDGKEVGTTPSLDQAIEKARIARNRECAPGNSKSEHRVQAHLIRQALMHQTGLPRLLDCEELFDQLIFVSDEFRLDDIRADVITLASKGGRYFPVYIELKAVRSLARVLEQLERVSNRLAETPEATVNYLAAASGVDAGLIETTPLRMLVWPASESGRESPAVSGARDRGFVTIGFTRPVDREFAFRRER